MKKVYVCLNDYEKNAISILEKNGFSITIRESSIRPNEEELCELVQNYDGIIIGIKEKMTDKVFSFAQNLMFIGTLSIGIDHISSLFFKDTTIKVINCPESNVISVAEHTFALILALYKKLIISHNATISGVGRSGLNGLPKDINNKTIGIIGVGKIGKKVINLAKAFNLNIVCHTLHPEDNNNLKKEGIKFLSIDDVFKLADIISIHIPYTIDTDKLIDKKLLDMMKPNSIIINTARAPIVDNDYLLSLLKEKKIFGAGIDIDIEEKELITSFSSFNNVILTPHTAGLTIDSIIRMDTDLAKFIVEYID